MSYMRKGIYGKEKKPKRGDLELQDELSRVNTYATEDAEEEEEYNHFFKADEEKPLARAADENGGVRKTSFVAAGKGLMKMFRKNAKKALSISSPSIGIGNDFSGINIESASLTGGSKTARGMTKPIPSKAPKRMETGKMDFDDSKGDHSGVPMASAALGVTTKSVEKEKMGGQVYGVPPPPSAPVIPERAPVRTKKGKMNFESNMDEDYSGYKMYNNNEKFPTLPANSTIKAKAVTVEANEEYTDRINELIEQALKSERTAPYNRTKLMVVGEGRAGKTSTIKALLHQAFDANELSTKGFDVKRVHACGWKEDNKGYLVEQLEKLVTEEKVKSTAPITQTGFRRSMAASMDMETAEELADLREERDIDICADEVRKYGKEFKFSNDKEDSLAFSIWDFGGQKVFYSLHHLFLTEYGCYLLVFNVKNLLSEEKKSEAIEYLKFWLFSKKIHAPTAPIIIVGTHAADVDKKELKAIDKIIKKQVLGKNQFYEVNNKKLSFFPIDNRTAEGIELLRSKIEDVVRKQEYIKKCVPISFLRVIELLLDREEPYLAINDAIEIVDCCGLNADFFQAALSFLSERGLITYFSEHETLRRFVILQPQWLISAITDIVYDEEEHPTPEFDDCLARDFRKFESERVLTKELLTNIWDKKGYSPELQKFLARVMRKSSLMCQYDFDSVESYLVPSLFTVEVNGECHLKETEEYYSGPCFVIDFSGNYSEKIIKDDGRLYVRYMPYGFFERLICLCVELSSKYTGSIKPKIGNKYAMLSFGTEIDFEMKVVNDKTGRPLWIKVRTEEDAEMLIVRNLVQKIYSMIDGLKKDFFTKNSECSNLAVSLLLPSSEESGNELADYLLLADAFKTKPFPKRIRPNQNSNKKVALATYRHWFCDNDGEKHENLINPDAALPTPKEQLEKAPALQQISSSLALPDDLEHHCFLSYKQSSAIDMVGKQYYILSSKGFKCWYDQQYRGALNLESMMEGVKKSMCYILFLSKDIFPSKYVEAEVTMALKLNKPIMLLHHPDTGSVGYWSFGDYINNAPDIMKPLFSKIESIQLQRRHYLEEAVTQVIYKRLHDIHRELTN